MINQNICIRIAKKDDAETIAGFQLLMAKETENLELDKNTVLAGVNAVFNVPTKGKYFVATHGDRVIACLLTTYEWSDWRNGMVLWIHSLYIVPEHRNQGLFREMYHHLEDIVLNSSTLKGLRLYVDKTNKIAQEAYKAVGMNGEHYQLFEWLK